MWGKLKDFKDIQIYCFLKEPIDGKFCLYFYLGILQIFIEFQ